MVSVPSQHCRAVGVGAAKAGDESFISPVPGPGDSACCCQKLPSGCTSACFRGAGGEEEEKDLLKVPMAPSQVLISTDWLLSLTYAGPRFPVQCLCLPSNKGCVYVWMILVISLASTTTVAYSLPHSVYFWIQYRNFIL